MPEFCSKFIQLNTALAIQSPKFQGEKPMKSFLITLSACVSISAFSASQEPVKIANDNLICVLKEVSYEFQLDYSLSGPEHKTKKLTEALIFEDYLHTQIRLENDRYDQLAMDKASSDRKISKKIRRSDISKQYQTTMDLVSQAESLAKYISWLRS